MSVEKNINDALNKKIRAASSMKKLGKRDLNNAGTAAIKVIKKYIAKGVSPISGERKFKAYINPKRYPGNRKRNRPVNLKLSGKFLKALKRRTKPGLNPVINIGFFDDYGKTLESGHREGVNGQPSRPIIPEGNEKYKRKVLRAIKDSIIEAFKKKKK